jgi:hypothetical protein
MADPTIRTCYECEQKFRKGYGEKYCPRCKRKQLQEELQQIQLLYMIRQSYGIY